MPPKPVYTPPRGLRTPLEDFMDYVRHEYGVKIVDESLPINQFPKFFQDAQLNYAENMLSGASNNIMITGFNETNLYSPEIYTWGGMRSLVATYSDALRKAGIQRGDFLVSIGSNCARSLAILLASATVGSVIANFATDIGEKALGDRLDQLRPKVIFAQTRYSYNGKWNDIQEKVGRCTEEIRKKQDCRLVIIGEDTEVGCEHTTFEDFISKSKGAELKFEQLPFNTPMTVMFSSGTTGAPKGIVHGHGGLILNGYKEHLLHSGMGPQDVHLHFTNIGWTLWGISLGALFCKTPMVLYDGSPFYPSPEELLKVIFSHGVTGFGAGPRYYQELQKHNIKPRNIPNKVHSIYSTGAVLTSSLASWVAEAFGPVCQIQFSGGTELCGSFFHGTRSLPSYPGECAVKELGEDMDVFTADGKPAPDGERGELVCKKPFPNMPVMFLNDPKHERYHAAYFEGFPNVWTHGDFVMVNPETRGVYVLGRSDGVLNPSGVRFGSAEMYTVMDSPALKASIADALVVGQQRNDSKYSDSTEQVLLFIKCTPEAASGKLMPEKQLIEKLRKQVIKDLSRRHVPHYIFETDEIPYNVNGKKLETLVKKIINGGPEMRAKLKMTEDEGRMMKKYERFYDVEQVVKKEGSPSAKL